MGKVDILFFEDFKKQADEVAGDDRNITARELCNLAVVENATPDQLISLSNAVGIDMISYIAALSTGPKGLEGPTKSYSNNHFKNDGNNEAA